MLFLQYNMLLKLPIYLDHHATTPVDPRVAEAMIPYLSEHFGNAASGTHSFGWHAEEAVNIARRQVATLIGAVDSKEIVWTSGTTEANNLALMGIARAYASKGRHLVTSAIEHRSVLDTSRALEREGFRVTILPVDSEGLVDPDDVRKAIAGKTILISIMAANNEIGTVQPIAEIGKIAKEKGVLFHVDAAQACGKIPVDVQAMGIDLLSMSAHKLYGPKGIGALYVRERDPRVRLTPLLFGGGQERGIRPGTLAVQNIVGMGKSFEIAGQEMAMEGERILKLRQRLHDRLMKALSSRGGTTSPLRLNGHSTCRLSGNLNLSFSGVRADALIPKVRGVALSSGSACASATVEPSYVIRALGGDEARALSSIRFGIGRFNTEEEIDYTVKKIVEAVRGLRLAIP